MKPCLILITFDPPSCSFFGAERRSFSEKIISLLSRSKSDRVLSPGALLLRIDEGLSGLHAVLDFFAKNGVRYKYSILHEDLQLREETAGEAEECG